MTPPPFWEKIPKNTVFFFGRPPLGKPSFKKIYFAKKFQKRVGGGGHLEGLSLPFTTHPIKLKVDLLWPLLLEFSNIQII